MSTFILADSQLVDIINTHLQRPRSSRQAARLRTVFLPWFSLNADAARDNLKNLAGALRLPLLTLPAHYSVTHDVRLLAELARKLCDPQEAEVLKKSLEQLPYSASLEQAVLDRIHANLHRAGANRPMKLAIAALKPGADADSSVGRMLDWAATIGLSTVLVLAHKRPLGLVETIDLPISKLQIDVANLIAARRPDILREAPGDGTPERTEKSFYRRLLAHFNRVASKLKSSIVVAPHGATGAWPVVDETDDDVADWADLLARLSAANWGVVEEITGAWQALDPSILAYWQRLGHEAHLNPDNIEERETLEMRLRFVEMLRVLYPEVFEAAVRELDGADQLYRVLLILCGQTAGDSLVASNLLPFWQEQLDDPLFRELCYACFNEIGRDRSLVPRIESRAQLYRLLALAEKSGSFEAEQQTELEKLFTEHRTWIRQLSAGAISYTPIPKLVATALDVIATNPTATDALQAGQVLMSAYELPADDEVDEVLDRATLFWTIEHLTRRAINQSRGAIRFDATLLRARALAVKGDGDAALDILRIMRRTVRDQLSRCAVDIEEAFVHERGGDYLRATHLYQTTLAAAERLGADELVARSANGCLRCDAAAYKKNSKRLVQMRARIIVEIQSARAPELFPMTHRSKPTLFISYRNETRSLSVRLMKQLRKNSALNAWADNALAKHEDFNPTIHRLLHDSDAIVILLSPGYFDSPWCVHELHFALGQNDVRGVPLFWAWCSNAARPGLPCELAARNEFDQHVMRTYGAGAGNGHAHPSGGPVDGTRLSYQRAHVEERLGRLFARGRLLVHRSLAYGEKRAADDAAEQLRLELDKTAAYLYSRAKLLQPLSSAQADDDPKPPPPPRRRRSNHREPQSQGASL